MSKGYMPSVINRFNIYLRKNRLFGHTGEVELPAVKFLTETLEGAGVGGTMDIAVTGLTENMEISIPFTCISQDMARMLDPTEPLDLTLRGAVQAMDQGSGTLNAALGVKPRQLLELMARMVESGTPAVLLIGPRRIGQNQWVLTKSSEVWNRVYAHGELVQAETSLTLKEYVAEVNT